MVRCVLHNVCGMHVPGHSGELKGLCDLPSTDPVLLLREPSFVASINGRVLFDFPGWE